ncbi:MAG: hypothetical protein LBI04_05130 [Treponema sp.]|jgi:hypothetical protein|nr:hypothetical protein [Treponema sp.]
MKKNRPNLFLFAATAVFLLFFSACGGPIHEHDAAADSFAPGTGRLVVTADSTRYERSAMPQEPVEIAEYRYAIIRQGETLPCWSDTGSFSSVTVELQQGTYSVAVSGFNDNAQMVAEGTGEVEINAGQISNVPIQLRSAGGEEGMGTLRYSLTIADDVFFQYGFLSAYSLANGALSMFRQFEKAEDHFFIFPGNYRLVISAYILKDGIMQTKTKTVIAHVYINSEAVVTLELDENSGAEGVGYTVSTAAELDTALNSIRTGAEKNVLITVTADFSHAPISLSDAGYNGKVISLRSVDPADVQTLTLSGNGSLFTVGSEQASPTMVLCDIKLSGHSTNNVPLLQITKGTLIVNDGAEISGNTNYNDINSSSFSGGGVAVESGALLKMYGGTIKGNTVSSNVFSKVSGGGVVVRGIFEMYGGFVENNNIPSGNYASGSGVMVESDGLFRLFGGNIRNNTIAALNFSTGGHGVAVNGTFEMFGGSIDHHRDERYITDSSREIRGLGIYVSSSGTVVMNGGEVAYNTIVNDGSGAGIYTEGTFTLNGGHIHNNSISANRSSSEAYGGGIFYGAGNLLLKGGDIYQNAALAGGGISFRKSGATGSYIAVLDGTMIYENSAWYGGGVVAYNTLVTIESGSIHSNTLLRNNKFGGGYPVGGAGIYCSGNSLVINGGSITNNTIELDETSYPFHSSDKICGGGIYIRPGQSGLTPTSGTLTLNGGLIQNNRITVINNAYGGGICSDVPVTINKNARILENSITTTLTAYGAGICATGNVTLNGGKVESNFVGSGTNAANGGGLYTEGTFTFVDGLIINNDLSLAGTSHGGGVYVTGADSAITMSGGKVAANRVVNTGGGIYYNGKSISGFNMRGGVISGNSATQGGGILLGSISSGVSCSFEKNFYAGSTTCGIIYGNEVTGTDEFGYDLKNTGTGAAVRLAANSRNKNTTVGETMTLFHNSSVNWAD